MIEVAQKENTEDLLLTLVKQQAEIIKLLQSINENLSITHKPEIRSDQELDWSRLMEVGKHQKQTYNMIRRFFPNIEFTVDELEKAIINFQNRDRRFGS